MFTMIIHLVTETAYKMAICYVFFVAAHNTHPTFFFKDRYFTWRITEAFLQSLLCFLTYIFQ